jgi:hypothetical protein
MTARHCLCGSAAKGASGAAEPWWSVPVRRGGNATPRLHHHFRRRGSGPLAARAQQQAMPVVGFLDGVSNDAERIAPIRQGLKQAGFVEGQNVTIEYRSADGVYDRLPAMAAEFVRQRSP